MIETLFFVMLTEVVLGGGGRTFAFGPITLRMLLFAACLLTWMAATLSSTKRRDGQGLAILLVVSFFASLIPGLLVDAANGTDIKTIALELQPLLFWLLAPFIAMALQDEGAVRRSATIILYGGLAVAVVTMAIMFGLQNGFVDFGRFYIWSTNSGEIFFRSPSNFFYKGDFYIGVSAIFCVSLREKAWKIICIILLASVVMSLTRGLYLAVMFGMVLSLISTRRSLSLLLVLIAGTVFLILYGNVLVDFVFDPSRRISYQGRISDLTYFLETFDYKTLLFGEGTGTLLHGRQEVENSFVWSIWRFGVINLLFWMMPLVIAVNYFRKIPYADESYRLAVAFFCGLIMLYVLTNTNPFINNSIGLIFAICAIFSLRRLSIIARLRVNLRSVNLT